MNGSSKRKESARFSAVKAAVFSTMLIAGA